MGNDVSTEGEGMGSKDVLRAAPRTEQAGGSEAGGQRSSECPVDVEYSMIDMDVEAQSSLFVDIKDFLNMEASDAGANGRRQVPQPPPPRDTGTAVGRGNPTSLSELRRKGKLDMSRSTDRTRRVVAFARSGGASDYGVGSTYGEGSSVGLGSLDVGNTGSGSEYNPAQEYSMLDMSDGHENWAKPAKAPRAPVAKTSAAATAFTARAPSRVIRLTALESQAPRPSSTSKRSSKEQRGGSDSGGEGSSVSSLTNSRSSRTGSKKKGSKTRRHDKEEYVPDTDMKRALAVFLQDSLLESSTPGPTHVGERPPPTKTTTGLAGKSSNAGGAASSDIFRPYMDDDFDSLLAPEASEVDLPDRGTTKKEWRQKTRRTPRQDGDDPASSVRPIPAAPARATTASRGPPQSTPGEDKSSTTPSGADKGKQTLQGNAPPATAVPQPSSSASGDDHRKVFLAKVYNGTADRAAVRELAHRIAEERKAQQRRQQQQQKPGDSAKRAAGPSPSSSPVGEVGLDSFGLPPSTSPATLPTAQRPQSYNMGDLGVAELSFVGEMPGGVSLYLGAEDLYAASRGQKPRRVVVEDISETFELSDEPSGTPGRNDPELGDGDAAVVSDTFLFDITDESLLRPRRKATNRATTTTATATAPSPAPAPHPTPVDGPKPKPLTTDGSGGESYAIRPPSALDYRLIADAATSATVVAPTSVTTKPHGGSGGSTEKDAGRAGGGPAGRSMNGTAVAWPFAMDNMWEVPISPPTLSPDPTNLLLVDAFGTPPLLSTGVGGGAWQAEGTQRPRRGDENGVTHQFFYDVSSLTSSSSTLNASFASDNSSGSTSWGSSIDELTTTTLGANDESTSDDPITATATATATITAMSTSRGKAKGTDRKDDAKDSHRSRRHTATARLKRRIRNKRSSSSGGSVGSGGGGGRRTVVIQLQGGGGAPSPPPPLDSNNNANNSRGGNSAPSETPLPVNHGTSEGWPRMDKMGNDPGTKVKMSSKIVSIGRPRQLAHPTPAWPRPDGDDSRRTAAQQQDTRRLPQLNNNNDNNSHGNHRNSTMDRRLSAQDFQRLPSVSKDGNSGPRHGLARSQNSLPRTMPARIEPVLQPSSYTPTARKNLRWYDPFEEERRRAVEQSHDGGDGGKDTDNTSMSPMKRIAVVSPLARGSLPPPTAATPVFSSTRVIAGKDHPTKTPLGGNDEAGRDGAGDGEKTKDGKKGKTKKKRKFARSSKRTLESDIDESKGSKTPRRRGRSFSNNSSIAGSETDSISSRSSRTREDRLVTFFPREQRLD